MIQTNVLQSCYSTQTNGGCGDAGRTLTTVPPPGAPTGGAGAAGGATATAAQNSARGKTRHQGLGLGRAAGC